MGRQPFYLPRKVSNRRKKTDLAGTCDNCGGE
jgi:hypothetical protein